MHIVEYREPPKRDRTFWEKIKGVVVPREKHEVVFWDSPEVMPYGRYHAFNRHFMTACGVGSSMGDYNQKQSKAIAYLKIKDIESANKELINQQQGVYNALTEYSPRGMALASWCYSIDGVRCVGYDDAILSERLKKFTEIGFSWQLVLDTLETVKKK